jgi:anti-sigma regulatory factor (Ser/Thr protein kinase)
VHPGWPNGAPDHAIDLSGGATAPAAARRAVSPFLERHLDEERLQEAVLLVSEVVTNAVRHGGAGEDEQVGVAVGVDDRYVRIEVRDPGDGFVPDPEPSRRGGSGMGLVLLKAISPRYGVEVDRGTRVWFDLPRAS